MRTPAWWQKHLLLLVLAGLCACSAAEDPEKLMASAEKAKEEGNLQVAADLYHRTAGLRPDDFQTQYWTGLLYLQVNNLEQFALDYEVFTA